MIDLGRRFFGLVDVAEVDNESIRMNVRLAEAVGIAEVINWHATRAEGDGRTKSRSLPKVVLWVEVVVNTNDKG